jgi:hypothetical protein
VDFDRHEFLSCVAEIKESLEPMHDTQVRVQDQRSDMSFDRDALLPEKDMERILRYEERMYRQIDSAVQRLLETQERRRTTEPE